jgi:hypothetical protein
MLSTPIRTADNSFNTRYEWCSARIKFSTLHLANLGDWLYCVLLSMNAILLFLYFYEDWYPETPDSLYYMIVGMTCIMLFSRLGFILLLSEIVFSWSLEWPFRHFKTRFSYLFAFVRKCWIELTISAVFMSLGLVCNILGDTTGPYQPYHG